MIAAVVAWCQLLLYVVLLLLLAWLFIITIIIIFIIVLVVIVIFYSYICLNISNSLSSSVFILACLRHLLFVVASDMHKLRARGQE